MRLNGLQRLGVVLLFSGCLMDSSGETLRYSMRVNGSVTATRNVSRLGRMCPTLTQIRTVTPLTKPASAINNK